MPVDFSTQTTPQLGELEDRLDAVESAVLVLTDGVWTKWTISVDAMTGATDVTVDPQPTNFQSLSVAANSPVSMTSSTLEVVSFMTLANGFQYEMSGVVTFTATGAGNQVVGVMTQAVSTSNSALPSGRNDYTTVPRGATISAGDQSNTLAPTLLDLTAANAPVPVYLLAKVSYAGGSGGISAYGFLRAKPVP